ncbi:MAG: hypothetical protein MUO82_00150 [Candidatus Thermoplasmatota archaeon]|nr:hypothetical protein [Candidatus Thermoplasmatota archaeon]
MIYYSFDHNNHDPDTEYILDHYEQFNNTKVTLIGEVKDVDRTNNTLLIQIGQSPPKGIILLISTTENLNTTQPGDNVEVYGVLTSKNSITAEKLLISERWAYSLIFIRSLPAIPFVMYLFFRTWRFNRNTYRFERREKHG